MRRIAIGVLVSCSGLFQCFGASSPSILANGIVPMNSAVNTIQPGEFVSIYGANLGPYAPVTWTGVFVTSLGATTVTIDGIPAYPIYVSSTLINVQAPNDTNTGPVSVVVTTPAGTASSTVTLAQFGPSFLLLNGKHVAAIIVRSNGSARPTTGQPLVHCRSGGEARPRSDDPDAVLEGSTRLMHGLRWRA